MLAICCQRRWKLNTSIPALFLFCSTAGQNGKAKFWLARFVSACCSYTLHCRSLFFLLDCLPHLCVPAEGSQSYCATRYTMSCSPVLSTATVVLGKRKERPPDNLVLRLASSPPPSHDAQTESEFEVGSSSAHQAFLGRRIPRVKKHQCMYEGCTKAYSKPSRLGEHVRSHTGDVRP